MTIDLVVYPRRVQHHRLLSLGDLLYVEWLAAERVHQVQQELAYHHQLLEALLRGEGKIIEGEGKIMTAVQVQQEDLDTVGTKIEALVAAVDSIDTTQLPPGSLDSVNAALTDLTTHVNAKVPGVTVTPPASDGGGDTTTPPADGSTPPADGSTPPADGSTPPADGSTPAPVNEVPET